LNQISTAEPVIKDSRELKKELNQASGCDLLKQKDENGVEPNSNRLNHNLVAGRRTKLLCGRRRLAKQCGYLGSTPGDFIYDKVKSIPALPVVTTYRKRKVGINYV